jgi:outer membrane protein assembly factor BamB
MFVFGLFALLLAAPESGPLTGADVRFAYELKQGLAGPPAALGGAESAVGVVATLGSGEIAVIGPRGERVATMRIDLAPACAAVAADLDGSGAWRIVAADVWGSIYAFDATGKRVWKYQRFDKTGGGYSRLVVADIDGDGKREVILTGARGGLWAVDSAGRLRFELRATSYRLSAPAVGDVNGDGRDEIVTGSEDSEIYCLTVRGELLWSRRLETYRFGRALPVIADIDGDGRNEVLVATPFVGPANGLFALEGRTGKVLWRAPSKLQTYHSIVASDLDGDGRMEILYGDKNTELHAVDPAGKPLWSRVLDGRGIYFSSVIADLEGRGRGIAFQTTRYAGSNGKSLYAVNSSGEVVDSLALEGGGSHPPLLCRFRGERDVHIVVAGESGKLKCLRPPQNAGAARILWPREGVARRSAAALPAEVFEGTAREARGGANAIDAGPPAPDATLQVRVREPGGVVRVTLIPRGMVPRTDFTASAAGRYEVDLRWIEAATNATRRTERYAYTLARPARIPPEVRTGTPVAVRQIPNPWPDLHEREFLSAYRGPMNRIAVRMLGNEYESAAIAITNLRAERATLRLDCGPFESGAEIRIAAEQVIEFRETPLVRPESTGRPTEDVLPKLAEGNLVWLGPNETRKIWLIFHSRDLAAGTHRAGLRIGDLLSVDPPLDVPVEITVHPVRLPEERVYRHGNWLYLASIADPKLRQATIDEAVAYGTNVFNIPAVSLAADREGNLGEASAEAHDSLVRQLGARMFFMVGGSVGLTWPKGFEPPAAVAEKAFAAAIRWYAEHMRSLGVGYERWAFYVMDEPGLTGKDSVYDNWAKTVRRIKAADPRAQIYANPAGGARAAVLADIADQVDVWQPDLHLVRDEPEALGKLFSRGQYWHYEAPADQRNLDPLGYYRMKPWVAFQMGMTGGGYWVYSFSPYWFFDRALTSEYGTVYPTGAGPVTTKRWEASRDGIEDFELLWMARRDGNAETRALVDEAVRFVTAGQDRVSDISRQVRPYTPDFGKWLEYRERLIAALAKGAR